MQREVVARGHELVPRHLGDVPRQIAQFVVGHLAVVRRTLRELDGHAEPQCAPGHGLADPAHARDPQRGAGDVLTHQQLRTQPLELTAAQELGGFVRTARRSQEQQHGHVRGGVVQHVRGVAHRDPVLRGRRHVDVVVPHPVVRDAPDPSLPQELRGEGVGGLGQHHVVLAARDRLPQLVGAHAAAGLHLPRVAQDARAGLGNLPGHQETGRAHGRDSSEWLAGSAKPRTASAGRGFDRSRHRGAMRHHGIR